MSCVTRCPRKNAPGMIVMALRTLSIDLGYFIESEKGRQQFKDTEKFMINRYFHDFLMKYFENVVIPKKWRFMEKLPVDVQGKKHKLEIMALFEEKQ